MLTNALIAAGAVCIFYFVMYMVVVDLTNLFTWFWLIAGAGLIGIALLRRYAEKKSIVVPVAVKRTVRAAACLALMVFFAVEAVIIWRGAAKPAPGADYVLVLGAQVKGKTPTYALAKRLDAACAYLKENPDTLVIVSGGKGPGEDVAEAVVMADYLEARGIAGSRILTEHKSRNTDENIRFSMELMESPEADVVLVTNYFHVYRGVGVAKKQGLTHVEGLGAPTKWYTAPNQYVREAFAVLKYKICGQI